VYLAVLIVTVFILSKKKALSLRPSPLPDIPWSLLEMALIFIVIELGKSLISGGFSAFAGTKAGELGEALSFPVAIVSLCIFFLFSFGLQRTITVFGLNHRLRVLQALFGIRWTLLYISCVFMLVVSVLSIEDLRQGALFQRVQHEWEVWGWLGLSLQLVTAVLAGPILEELMFRGLLYSAVRQKISMWPAILITSAVFMLYHGVTRYGTFFIGIFFSLLLEKSHSLLPAIIAHISHNFFMRVLTISLVLSDSSSVYLYFFGVGSLGIVGIFLVEIWLRKRRNLPFGWDSIWSVPR